MTYKRFALRSLAYDVLARPGILSDLETTMAQLRSMETLYNGSAQTNWDASWNAGTVEDYARFGAGIATLYNSASPYNKGLPHLYVTRSSVDMILPEAINLFRAARGWPAFTFQHVPNTTAAYAAGGWVPTLRGILEMRQAIGVSHLDGTLLTALLDTDGNLTYIGGAWPISGGTNRMVYVLEEKHDRRFFKVTGGNPQATVENVWEDSWPSGTTPSRLVAIIRIFDKLGTLADPVEAAHPDKVVTVTKNQNLTKSGALGWTIRNVAEGDVRDTSSNAYSGQSTYSYDDLSYTETTEFWSSFMSSNALPTTEAELLAPTPGYDSAKRYHWVAFTDVVGGGLFPYQGHLSGAVSEKESLSSYTSWKSDLASWAGSNPTRRGYAKFQRRYSSRMSYTYDAAPWAGASTPGKVTYWTTFGEPSGAPDDLGDVTPSVVEWHFWEDYRGRIVSSTDESDPDYDHFITSVWGPLGDYGWQRRDDENEGSFRVVRTGDSSEKTVILVAFSSLKTESTIVEPVIFEAGEVSKWVPFPSIISDSAPVLTDGLTGLRVGRGAWSTIFNGTLGTRLHTNPYFTRNAD